MKLQEVVGAVVGAVSTAKPELSEYEQQVRAPPRAEEPQPCAALPVALGRVEGQLPLRDLTWRRRSS